MSKKPKGNSSAVTVLLTVLIFVMIALTGLVIFMCVNLVNKTPQSTVRTETQIYTLPTTPPDSPTTRSPCCPFCKPTFPPLPMTRRS